MKSVYFEFDDNGKIVACSNEYFGDYCVKFDFVDGGLKLSDGQQERFDKMRRKNGILLEELRIKNDKLTLIISQQKNKIRELEAQKGRQQTILSEAGKIRMAAYNDAAKWNNAITAKFDAMIKDASKTIFGRFVEKPIWERMKRRWISKRIKKEY